MEDRVLEWRVPKHGFVWRTVDCEPYLVPARLGETEWAPTVIAERGGLYRAFAALADVRESEFPTAVLRFANLHGALSVGEFLELREIPSAAGVEIDMRPTCGGYATLLGREMAAVRGDSLVRWRTEVASIDRLVAAWSTADQVDSAKMKEFVEVSPLRRRAYWKNSDRASFDKNRELDSPLPDGVEVIEWPPSFPASLKEESTAIAALTKREVRARLAAALKERFSLTEDTFQRVPVDLLGAMWLQFADALTTGASYVKCAMPDCDNTWERSSRYASAKVCTRSRCQRAWSRRQKALQ